MTVRRATTGLRPYELGQNLRAHRLATSPSSGSPLPRQAEKLDPRCAINGDTGPQAASSSGNGALCWRHNATTVSHRKQGSNVIPVQLWVPSH